jgi:ethanolamine utilization protein EutN
VQLGRIIGTIVATTKLDRLQGVRLIVMEPLNAAGVVTGPAMAGIDVVSAGMGDLVYWVGSREAAAALEPPFTAVDVAIVGIVDRVDMLPSEGVGQ